MKYEIADAPSTEELEELVNQMIKEGWTPQGGVISYTINVHKALTGNLANNRFAQAMVRKGKNDS